MMLHRLVIIIGTAIILAACDNRGEEKKASAPVRDVEFFLKNPDERKATVAECDNNPGELAETPNCVNAYQADDEAMSRSIQDALK